MLRRLVLLAQSLREMVNLNPKLSAVLKPQLITCPRRLRLLNLPALRVRVNPSLRRKVRKVLLLVRLLLLLLILNLLLPLLQKTKE